MNDRERIGSHIAELRKSKGLSQVKLAELANLTLSNVVRIELGKYNTGIDVLSRIADALNCKLDIVE